MAGDIQGVRDTGTLPLWAENQRVSQQETEREKLQKTDIWSYAAQQAGAYMS